MTFAQWLIRAAIAVVSGGVAPVSTVHAQCYEITAIIEGPACDPPFDDPPPTSVTALSTTPEGEIQVLGYYASCQIGPDLPFVWTPSQGLVTLTPPPGIGNGAARDGVNGLVVGSMGGNVSPLLGLLYDGAFQELETMPDGNFSQAWAIALNGPTVVGTWGNNLTGPLHGIIWQGETTIDFGPIAGTRSSRLNDINEELQTVGWIGSSLADAIAVRYDITGGALEVLGPIPGGYTSEGNAINSVGQVTGGGRLPNPAGGLPLKQVFVHLNDQIINLGGMPEFDLNAGTAINDDGIVVGRSWGFRGDVNTSHAFIYNDGFADLNDLIPAKSGVVVTAAWAIDNQGHIAANGEIGNHKIGLLLTPVDLGLGDLNGDGSVGAFDLALMLAAWGKCTDCSADLDGDNSVGSADLAALLANWTC
jgi:probable HAF family extracellular repeat protein